MKKTLTILAITVTIFCLLSLGGALFVTIKNNSIAVIDTYQKYRTAVQNEDLNTLKGCLVKERYAELVAPDGKSKLKMIKRAAPSGEISVTSKSVSINNAVIEITAVSNKAKMKGKISLIKQDGVWKISKEEWTGGKSKIAPTPPKPQVPVALSATNIVDGPLLIVSGAKNYVINPSANKAAGGWIPEGDVTIEIKKGNPVFVARYSGNFTQYVKIPESTGKYALLIACASAEWVHADGDQTGYPYLFGNWVNSDDPKRLNGFMTSHEMVLKPAGPNKWSVISGIFKIPPKTGAIRLMIDQADGGRKQNGSNARFDDMGVFIFDREANARRAISTYRSRIRAIHK